MFRRISGALLQELAALCSLRQVLNDPEAAKTGGMVRAVPEAPEGLAIFCDYLPDEDFGCGHPFGSVVLGRLLVGGRGQQGGPNFSGGSFLAPISSGWHPGTNFSGPTHPKPGTRSF